MKEELISVIVPVYNVEKILPYSLESIINQTYKDLEIIVVNDGSTDSSPEICKEYAKKDKRIKIINQKNKGLSGARNSGIDVANGKYISFIDSDDVISNEFFSYLYKLIIETKSDIAECAFVKISENDVYEKNYKFDIKENYIITDSEGALNRLHNENVDITVKSVVVWNKLYKKSLFDDIRYPEGKLHEDDFTTYKILSKINQMVSTDAVLHNYVQREKSIMHQEFSPRRLDALEAFENYIDVFKEHEDIYLFDKCLIRYLRVLTTILEELYNSNYEEKNKIKNVLKEKYAEIVFMLQKNIKKLDENQRKFVEDAINLYNEKFYKIAQKFKKKEIGNMNIYVIRHGQTDYNVRKLFQGQMDINLNEVGKKQAEETAQKFEGVKIDNIISSPLSRAYKTAQYISKVTKTPIEIEEGLKERSFGQMEGKENREDCNIEMMLDYERNYDLYEIEPIQEFFNRVGICLEKIISKYKNRDIVLVTHAGVTQAIEFYFNGMPADKNLEAYALKNCEVRKYEIKD